MDTQTTPIIISICSCAKCASARSRYTLPQLDVQRASNVATEKAVRAALGDAYIIMTGSYDAHHREGLQCVKKIADKRCRHGYRLGKTIWIDPATYATGDIDSIVTRLQGVEK